MYICITYIDIHIYICICVCIYVHRYSLITQAERVEKTLDPPSASNESPTCRYISSCLRDIHCDLHRTQRANVKK